MTETFEMRLLRAAQDVGAAAFTNDAAMAEAAERLSNAGLVTIEPGEEPLTGVVTCTEAGRARQLPPLG